MSILVKAENFLCLQNCIHPLFSFLKALLQLGRFPSVLKNNSALWACCCALKFILLFSWKVTRICSLEVLSVGFLTVEFEKCVRVLSFCPLSTPYNPNWQCLRWYNILNHIVGLFHLSQRFTPLDKRFLHKSFLNDPKSIPGFGWDDQGDPPVVCLISPKSLLCHWI